MKKKIHYETVNTLYYGKYTHKICVSYKHFYSMENKFQTLRNFASMVNGKGYWHFGLTEKLKTIGNNLYVLLNQYDSKDYRFSLGYPNLFVVYTSNQDLIDQLIEYTRNHKLLWVNTIHQPHAQLEELTKEEQEINVKVRVVDKLPGDRFIYTADIRPKSADNTSALKAWYEGNESSLKCSNQGKQLLTEKIPARYYNIVRVHIEDTAPLMLLQLTAPQSIVRVHKNIIPKPETSVDNA